MRSPMLRRSILAATLAAGLLLALAGLRNPYALGLVDHEAMTASEQLNVLGGTTWQQHKQCMGGSGPCNYTDTNCGAGLMYCNQIQAPVECADAKDYQNPVRCHDADTEYECSDDDPGEPPVACYLYKKCVCEHLISTWACSSEFPQPNNEVPRCRIIGGG